VGRHSSVGVATCYGMDGPGIESRWGARFSTPVQTGPGLPQLLYNGCQSLSLGKAAGAWRWPHTPSSTEVKQSVQLYRCSPPGPSWSVIGWPLHFTYIIMVLLKCIIEERGRASWLLAAFRHAIQDCVGKPRSHCIQCLIVCLKFNAE